MYFVLEHTCALQIWVHLNLSVIYTHIYGQTHRQPSVLIVRPVAYHAVFT